MKFATAIVKRIVNNNTGAISALFSVIRPNMHNAYRSWEHSLLTPSLFRPGYHLRLSKFLYNQATFEIVKATEQHAKKA